LPDLSLSIALCTFNGAPFLREQLDSIATQTRLPDEVVVCDDASIDNSVEIVSEWARSVPFEVRIHANAVNIGTSANFSQAISLCRGDLIALSDQDDIWLPHKLAVTAGLLEERPEVGLAFSNFEVVDDNLQSLNYLMWTSLRFRGAEQRLFARDHAFDVLLRRNVVTGLTSMLRASYKNLVLPIFHTPGHAHDEWIAFLIAAVAPIGCIPAPTALYRQHARNQIGSSGPTNVAKLRRSAVTNNRAVNQERNEETIRWLRIMCDRLQTCEDSYSIRPDVYRRIDAKIAHLTRRNQLADSRLTRTAQITREFATLGYHRYSLGMWAAVKDILA
jgi:glycosyltransferase involved in cell wall biosynthesis